MSAQRNSDRQQASTSVAQPAHHPHHQSEVENASIRVLLDDATPIDCAVCDCTIEQQTRYRHLTVREHDGSLEEYSVCGEGCTPQHA